METHALRVSTAFDGQVVTVNRIPFDVRIERPGAEVADVPDIAEIDVVFPDPEVPASEERREHLRLPFGGFVPADYVAVSLTETHPIAGVIWAASDPESLLLFVESGEERRFASAS